MCVSWAILRSGFFEGGLEFETYRPTTTCCNSLPRFSKGGDGRSGFTYLSVGEALLAADLVKQ